MRRMINLGALIFGLGLMLAGSNSFGFMVKEDEAMVLNGLQRLANEGLMGEHQPVSFDRIACNRSFCLIEMRVLAGEDDFGSIQRSKCVVEDVKSMYDVIDESEKNKKKEIYPFTKLFFETVKSCVAGVHPSEEG